MVNLRSLRSLRNCATIAALIAPQLALSEALPSVAELRTRLTAYEASNSQQLVAPLDIAALRVELGLSDEVPAVQKILPGPVAVPTPQKVQRTFNSGGGLFSLQSEQTTQARPAAKTPTFRPVVKPTASVQVGTTNFRLMLATLAQTYGESNNLALMTAQGTRGPTALSVRSGTVTLSDIHTFFAANGMPPRADGTIVAPLVIWPGATLRLSPGERLTMARDTGAFILSMGHLDINGATIEAVGPENEAQPGFAPFITVLGGGSLTLVGSTLRGLGFGKTYKFAGLAVAGNPLIPSDQKVEIRGNLFDQMNAVAVAGTPNARVADNTFNDARGTGLVLMNAPYTKVRNNLFRGDGPTNAIRVDRGSERSVISENVLLRGDRAAVLIKGRSTHVQVRDNLIWGRNGTAIKFQNATCGVAESNILIDSRQKGIEVRKSDGVTVRSNLIAANHTAAVWISAQAKGAQTSISDNIFQANGAGLSAATGAEIWISGNNFSGQLPRILDGDIVSLTTSLVHDLHGNDPMRFSNGQVQMEDAMIDLCGGEL